MTENCANCKFLFLNKDVRLVNVAPKVKGNPPTTQKVVYHTPMCINPNSVPVDVVPNPNVFSCVNFTPKEKNLTKEEE